MSVTDSSLIREVINAKDKLIVLMEQLEAKPKNVEYPVDEEICGILGKINEKLDASDDEFRLFYFSGEIKNLWKMLIEKSIKCLRGFDQSEPFIQNQDKSPLAYGIDDLEKYFERYVGFESMLYGSGKYYRDHVVHVFRVWLIGLGAMLSNDMKYVSNIDIDKNFEVNIFEKISIWTLISLTHDLGYPLEKAQDIVEKTKDMMKLFVASPTVNMDISFNGVQTNMNDFVLKFMSSKMKDSGDKDCPYTARLQPKYYYKFQKSLENYRHGVLSAIILYKLLIYFLESDFSINEDYSFTLNEARQFYIRREILRAISSHTCTDIYHLNMHSFAFLLIVADDCQGWGRKQISNLYLKSSSQYTLNWITMKSDGGNVCSIDEEFKINEKYENSYETLKMAIENVLKGIHRQYEGYKIILRDGPDTNRRDFNFTKSCKISCTAKKTVNYLIKMDIDKDRRACLHILAELSNDDVELGQAFIEKLFKNDKTVVKEQKMID